MVHIINGEIVQDNDPRIMKKQGSKASRPSSSSKFQSVSSLKKEKSPPSSSPSPLDGIASTLGLTGTT